MVRCCMVDGLVSSVMYGALFVVMCSCVLSVYVCFVLFVDVVCCLLFVSSVVLIVCCRFLFCLFIYSCFCCV